MREPFVTLAAMVMLAACAEAPTSPPVAAGDLISSVLALSTTGLTGTISVGREVALLQALPASLKLSDQQRAQVNDLVSAHARNTQADRDTLNAIVHRALVAIQSGASRSTILAILDQAHPVQERLAAADSTLATQIRGILTAEQRAWLDSQTRSVCDPTKFPPLSTAQQQQIATLEASYRQSTQADIQAVQAALLAVQQAQAAGKSPAEIQAILDSVKPALDRLAAAMQTLRQQITAVYTPEQKASGCIPFI